MQNFFRKVAGAFVELPPEAPQKPAHEPEMSSADIADLLRQIPTPPAEAPVEPPPTPNPAPRAAPEPAPKADAPPSDVLNLTPDQIFEAAGIEDGPNSAQRLLKMLAGLAMFPPEQQLAMVRALDAADASWSESNVLADARLRQQTLRTHLDKVERDYAKKVAAISERGRDAQNMGDATVADIDRQILELQRLRQEALGETARGIAALDAERRDVDASVARARSAINEAQSRFSQLINFFAGQHTASHGN